MAGCVIRCTYVVVLHHEASLIRRHRWGRRRWQLGLDELCFQLPPCISVVGFVPPPPLSSMTYWTISSHRRPQIAVSAVETLVGGVAWPGPSSLRRLAPLCVSPSRCPAHKSVSV